MLLRCATGLMTGPAVLGAGLVFASGVATGVALGAGMAGAALVGKRLWEERRGWRAGADADEPLPPSEPAAEAPGL